MKCPKCCSGSMKVVSGQTRVFISKIVGNVYVADLTLFSCNEARCDAEFMPLDSASKMSSAVKSLEEIAINSIPIGDFVSAGAAAGLIGITKQAFSAKVEKFGGLFMKKTLESRDYYYRPSILAYMATGDGRIELKDGIYCGKAKEEEFETTEISTSADYQSDSDLNRNVYEHFCSEQQEYPYFGLEVTGV